MSNSYPDQRYHDLLFREDTIVAVSTPSGPGAIGIVRVSGPRSRELADGVFRPAGKDSGLPARKMVYGWLRTKEEIIDEAQCCTYDRPHSFTGEDMAEFFVHGSPAVLRRLVSLLTLAGARPAEPGEYTLRAFRNGRLDLDQAEAVNDLVRTDTDLARHLAVRTLRGDLRRAVEHVRGRLEDILVRVETELEFEIEETGAARERDLGEGLVECLAALEDLAEAGRRQSAHRRGAVVVLCGKPNVGKSSLLNRILRRERAIVSSLPGTTRDTIEEAVEVDGVPMVFIDTAGYLSAASEPDALGVERTVQAVGEADFIVLLLDLTREVDDEDRAVLERVRAAGAAGEPIVLANKSDLVSAGVTGREAAKGLSLPSPRRISAKTGENVDAFLDDLCIRVRAGETLTGGVDFLINDRHVELLDRAVQNLHTARQEVEQGITLDIIAERLYAAHRTLGRILGVTADEDIIDKVFSRFCIGK